VAAALSHPAPLLDGVAPHWHFNEVHRRVVGAAPGAVWAAMAQVTLGEMRLSRLLFALRSLPARLIGGGGLPRATDEPVLAQMYGFGFVPLGDEVERELVAGVIGRSWKPTGEIVRVAGADEFAAFDRPGFIKAAMNFLLEPVGPRTELVTETRVVATSDGARRAFLPYWIAIRAGSGAIRRDWLRAIAERAEAGRT
jgi:hypothetical protein